MEGKNVLRSLGESEIVQNANESIKTSFYGGKPGGGMSNSCSMQMLHKLKNYPDGIVIDPKEEINKSLFNMLGGDHR